jgi:hypothetical protein
MSASANRERVGEGRLNGMIIISLLLHGFVLSLLFLSPSFPSPKMTFGPVYTVSLVDFSESIFETGGDTAAVRELLGAASPVTTFKKHLAQEPLNLFRSLAGYDRREETLEKAMAEIRKRAAAMPRPTESASSLEQAGPVSPMSAAALNAKMDAYKVLIRSRIKGKWIYPIQPGEQWETSVDMRILRSGVVADVSIEKRSGNRS